MRDYAAIRRVLLITLALHAPAAALKLGSAWWAGSLSIAADGLETFFDGMANVVGLVGLYIASRPPDREHPYGHRKFETLAAMVIAGLLFLTCWELARAAVLRLWEGALPLTLHPLVIAALLAAMLIQLAIGRYELGRGKELQSEILLADARHTLISVLISLAVLGGLGLSHWGWPQADPLLALLVSLVIAKVGIDIVRENVPALVDEAPISPERLAAVVDEVSGVTSYHRIRSRGALGNVAVDLHVRVDPQRSLPEANAIGDEVRRRLLELPGISDVTVHVEAQRGGRRDPTELYATAKHVAEELGLSLHEMWAHWVDDRIELELHVGADPDMDLQTAHSLADGMEKELTERLPDVLRQVQTHIELAAPEILPADNVDKGLHAQVVQKVNAVVAAIEGLRSPHNVRVRRSNDRLYIALEVVSDPERSVTEIHDLATLLEETLNQEFSNVGQILVHVEPPASGNA